MNAYWRGFVTGYFIGNGALLLVAYVIIQLSRPAERACQLLHPTR